MWALMLFKLKQFVTLMDLDDKSIRLVNVISRGYQN